MMNYDSTHDFYMVLGIKRTASQEEITAAYRELVKQHHPDRGGEAEDFKEIQEAYEILSHSEKRCQYDEAYARWRTGATSSSQNQFQEAQPNEDNIRENLKQLLNQLHEQNKSLIFLNWLIDEVMDDFETESMIQMVNNYLQDLHPLIDFEVDEVQLSLKHLLEDDRNSIEEKTEVRVIDIDEALKEKILFRQSKNINISNNKTTIAETRIKLDDGCIVTAIDIERGHAYNCPNCEKWVQRKNIKRDSSTGKLICILCAVAIEKKFYSRKTAFWKTVKDFWGAE